MSQNIIPFYRQENQEMEESTYEQMDISPSYESHSYECDQGKIETITDKIAEIELQLIAKNKSYLPQLI